MQQSMHDLIHTGVQKFGYEWNNDKLVNNSLCRTCRIQNDIVLSKLPIQQGLLELVLFETGKKFFYQPYLELLFRNLFCIGYLCMFRIGELTTGSHPILAKNVHQADNKSKLLFVLYSSKTHGKYSKPQTVKISAIETKQKGNKFYCPFELSREYLAMRGEYSNEKEPYFIFSDGSPVRT